MPDGGPLDERALRVLMITSEWPSERLPHAVPFIVRQVKFLRKAGVDLHLFTYQGQQNPLNYARAWREVRRELDRNAYDLVHAQWGQSGLLALPKRLPLVVTFRGDDLEGIIGEDGRQTVKGKVLRRVSRMVARRADQTIAVSPSLAAAMPWRSSAIIPSGLDLDLFCPAPQAEARQRLGLDPQRRYVLFAASPDNPRKRFWLAQQAVDLLKAEMDIELITATHILHEQVPDYMNASDALLLTSLHEGSPNVVKEALACNLRVVSTHVGDVRQRVRGIAGCAVVDDDSPAAIAAALRESLAHPGPIDSRKTVRHLDENLLTQQVINVYQQALAAR